MVYANILLKIFIYFSFITNLYMKFIFTFLLSFFYLGSALAQNNHEFVALKEKTKGKRLELFAVNTNSLSYDVFLRVETEDYRRSSSRPVIKTIPPNSEVRLITMVKLAGKEGKYNTTFVVNEIGYELSIRKDKSDFNAKLNDALKSKQITIFTKDSCTLCDDTRQLLKRNRIIFTEYSIEKDSINLIQLIKEFKKVNLTEKAIAPILKIEDSLYTSIRSEFDLINALKNHF